MIIDATDVTVHSVKYSFNEYDILDALVRTNKIKLQGKKHEFEIFESDDKDGTCAELIVRHEERKEG